MEKQDGSEIKNVAIIGAGIVGLYLALKLSEKGYRVTVFEKGSGIRNKVCSGLISERIKDFINIEDSFIRNKINSCLVHFPSKNIVLEFKQPHFVFDREELNKFLFNLARKAGAKVIFNSEIKDFPAGFDRIIGCDGALSWSRKKISQKEPSFRLGIQAFVPEKNSSASVEVWPTKDGFLWKIPRGENTEYGSLDSPKSAGKNFEKYFFETASKNKIYLKSIKSALVPQGLVFTGNKENVALCGDAAGLTKPWSGGGVIWGLTAADILVSNFPDFKAYQRMARLYFLPQIFLGKLVVKIFNLMNIKFSWVLPSSIKIDNDFPFFRRLLEAVGIRKKRGGVVLPEHVAIIMDGNRRWAKRAGLPAVSGHKEGVLVLGKIVKHAIKRGIKVLTVYAFSTENWNRSKEEIDFLFGLIREYIKKEGGKLKGSGVQARISGSLEKLPKDLRKEISLLINETKENNKLVLNFAFNYGGRDEILRAVKKIIKEGLPPDEISEELFEKYLFTAGLPDPDIIIRTGGEIRLSNFLIWQGTYSELFFLDKFWPDFTEADFDSVLEKYRKRERKFGK